MNENKNALQNFIVINDGELDLSYLEALEREQRIQALHMLGHEAIALAGRAVKSTLHATLLGYSALYDSWQQLSE